MYSVNEAAKNLKLSPSQVRNLLSKGQIEGKKLGHDWVVLSLDYKRKRKPKSKKGATDIPKDIKIRLWLLMIDNVTYKTWIRAIVGKHYTTAKDKLFTEEELEFINMSSDTYKRLKNEVKEMPLNEVLSLPQDLQAWIFELRPELKEERAKEIQIGLVSEQTSASDQRYKQAWTEHFRKLLSIAEEWHKRHEFPRLALLCNLEPHGLFDTSIVATNTKYEESKDKYRNILLYNQFGLEDELYFRLLQEHLKDSPLQVHSREWMNLAISLKDGCTALYHQIREDIMKKINSINASLFSKECCKVMGLWDEYLDALKPYLNTLKPHFEIFYKGLKELGYPIAVEGESAVIYLPHDSLFQVQLREAIDKRKREGDFINSASVTETNYPDERLRIQEVLSETAQKVFSLEKVQIRYTAYKYAALRILFEEYVKLAYQRIASRIDVNIGYIEKDLKPMDYRIIKNKYNSKDWPFILYFGNAKLASFTDKATEAVNSLIAYHKAIIDKYVSSDEVNHIKELHKQFANIYIQLFNGFNLLYEKASLPGRCHACPPVP